MVAQSHNIQTTNKELEQMIESEYIGLCGVSTRLIGRNDIAEDIVQNCFVAFWEKIATYKDVESKKGLLYIMVRNESLNYIRTTKREQTRHTIFTEENESNYNDDVIFEKTLQEEVGERLDYALEQLAPQSQKVIRMSLTGMKNRDIAVTLGITVNSVKTLKYAAIKKIRELLISKYR